MYVEDTIVAIATAPGPGAIGIVRASGPAVAKIAEQVFVRAGKNDWETHRLYHGRLLRPDGSVLDEAMAVLMRAPRSYTGEDVLEVYCHGSPLVLKQATQAMLTAGARGALRGEFTKRAFVNGKMDLAQAEAVVDLVGARTPRGASLATEQLFGRLSGYLSDLRKSLIRIKGEIEVRIDFSDEDLETDETALLQATLTIRDSVAALLSSFAQGQLVREGLRVTIVGPPNAGKSSLMNALLQVDRAIVTDVAGTTRDIIEEHADFDGVPVVLRDTAGLRKTEDRVERIGVDRAERSARESDVVLLVLDSSIPAEIDQYSEYLNTNGVLVLSKADLHCAWRADQIADLKHRHEVIHVSATEMTGLDELRQSVVRQGTPPSDGTPVITSARQFDALTKVREHLDEFLSGIASSVPADLLAVDLQAALDHIGAVTGVITSEDVLDTIFEQFCIGK